MKPIIGELTYKEITPEDLERFKHEAEVLRSQAVRGMFRAAFRGLFQSAVHLAHGFRALVANPGIHPTAGTR